MARDLTNALLASPNQSSTVFGLGGAHPIRQKSSFVMRFLRKAGEGGEEWKSGLSFIVKSIDRPTIQPVVEELNQYNKKRVIHTGVKYSPVTCIVYDTADGAAMAMWVQYMQHYYGDYRQDAGTYKDDIISPKMLGNDKLALDGYGFGIQKTSTASIDGANTQFFFDRIDVYQVWGGEYTCFQLLNPRISNFDPDELDYEQSAASTITMGLSYEAIHHENGGRPQKVSANSALTELFGGIFNGEVPEPVPSATRTTSFTSTPLPASVSLSNADIQGLLDGDTAVTYTESDRSETTTSAGGALSKYGNFDFGDFTSIGSTLPSEVSLVTGNASQDIGGLNDPFPSWVKTTKQANELELARVQQSQRRANQDAVGSALGGNLSSISDIGRGVGTASLLEGNSPGEQVTYNDDFLAGRQDDGEADFGLSWAFPAPSLDADNDATIPAPAPNDAIVTGGKSKARRGMSLSPLALAAVNTNSDGRSQIGQRKNSLDNPLLAFVVEPKPSNILSPDLVYGRARALSVKIAATGNLMHLPRPVTGPILKAISIKAKGLGYVTQSGILDGKVIIRQQSRILNAISGNGYNVTWKFNLFMTAIAPVIGASRPDQYGLNSQPIPVIVNASARAQSTVAGSVDRKRLLIRGELQGEIKNRAATVFRRIDIRPTITGIVRVEGSINKPIVVKQNSIIIFPVVGPLNKEITIAASLRGNHIPMRSGVVDKQLVIKTFETTGIIKQPVIGTINKPITPAFIMLANHKQPVKGTVAKPLLIQPLAYGRIPFFASMTNKRIVIQPNIRGNVDAFGTLNRQVRINALATGSSLVFGTMSRPVIFGRNISGHSTTNVSPAHRYWRMRIASDQSVVGPNEIQFRDTTGNAVNGTVSASTSYNATYAPAKAFDRDGSTWWSTAIGQATGAWIMIDLGAGGDKEIKDILIATDDLARVPKRYDLQFSDDGTFWNLKATAIIPEPENNSIYVTRQVTLEPLTSETTKYRGMYRFRTTENAGDTVRIANMVLYNPQNQPIPAMSPFASSSSVGTAANAFDSDVNSVWVSSTAEANSATVGFYAATLDTQIGSITLRADPSTGGGATMPTAFVIEYSNNDGASWVEVFKQEAVPAFADGETRNITVGINGAVDVGDGSALQVNDDQDVLGY
jgi:hypothetical protein